MEMENMVLEPEVTAALATVNARYMTVKEASVQLGIGIENAYAAVNRGSIKSIELFGQKVCDRLSVAAYRPRNYPRKRKAAVS